MGPRGAKAPRVLLTLSVISRTSLVLLVETSSKVHPQTSQSVSFHQPEARRASSKARDADPEHVIQCDGSAPRVGV